MAAKKAFIRKTIRIAGKPKTMRFSTKAQADHWYAQMRVKKENARAGVEMPIDPILIEVAAANLLLERKGLENYLHDKFRTEHYILGRFFGRHLHTILRAEWKTLFQDLGNAKTTWKDIYGEREVPEQLAKKPFRPMAPKTLGHVKTLINKLYKEALLAEPPNAVRNPMAVIELPKGIDREKPHWKTIEDQITYLNGARDEHTSYWAFAMIALNTGMRVGEIIALKWSDIDFRSDSIGVWQTWDTRTRKVKGQTKTKKDRTVVINPKLKRALLIHREQTRFSAPTDHVVYRWKTGNVTDSKTLWEIHDRIISSAGLKYINIHGLRHTRATWQAAGDRNLYDLKTELGHKTITMTEKYVHLVTPKMREQAKAYGILGGICDDEMMTTMGAANASIELH